MPIFSSSDPGTQRWGATDDELDQPLPGDDEVLADSGRGRSSGRLSPDAQRLGVGQVIGEVGLTVQSFVPNAHLVLAYRYPKSSGS